MKLTLIQVGIKQKLPQLFQNPLYGYNISIFIIINVDEDIIQIYNDKDIKLPSKDFVDVSLEVC